MQIDLNRAQEILAQAEPADDNEDQGDL